MRKTIFRTINGRIVPLVVDDEFVSPSTSFHKIETPTHKAETKEFKTTSSFIIPNAICNACGQNVFYYENSYGSRVLFDELGPPWPIHPCYSANIKKDKQLSIKKEENWMPVFVDKGIITSSGGLRVQGILDQNAIRFTFDARTFLKMKISLDDVSGLIVFASKEERKIQTHNGKMTFTTFYESVKTTPTLNIETDLYKPSQGTPQSNIVHQEFREVGVLSVQHIELVLSESERMALIISGKLNRQHKVKYLLADDLLVNHFYDIFDDSQTTKNVINTVVLENSQEIIIRVKTRANTFKFNVAFINDITASKMKRIEHNGKNCQITFLPHLINREVKKRFITRKKLTKTIEQQISTLFAQIKTPSAMVDAFVQAKKMK